MPAAMLAAIRIWRAAHPGIRARSASAIYNCMGLVFASRRTWIETEHLHLILREDGYRQFTEPGKLSVGDVVVYKRNGEPSHVAIVLDVEPVIDFRAPFPWVITVMSQWGGDGEYIHRMEDVPQVSLGVPVEYWTERRVV